MTFEATTFVSLWFREEGENAHQLPDTEAFAIPANWVFFCDDDDEETERYVWQKRRAHGLEQKTLIVRVPKMPLLEYREQIEENRLIWVPCRLPPEHSSWNYLRRMNRYHSMLRVLQENPFASEYFAWMDLPQQQLTRQPTRRISCECRGYVPRSATQRWHEYFVKPEVAGFLEMGFFSGDATYMRLFCEAMMTLFRQCLCAGFGYSDVHLVYLVLQDHPEWFELTFKELPYRDFLIKIAPMAYRHKDWRFLRHGFRFYFGAVPETSPLAPSLLPAVFSRFVQTRILQASVGLFVARDSTDAADFYGEPGYMPYHLLGYISTWYRGKVFYVNHDELAGLALAMNPHNQVIWGGETINPLSPRPGNFQVAVTATTTESPVVIFFQVAENDPEYMARKKFDELQKQQYDGLVIWNGVYLAHEFGKYIQGILPKNCIWDWSEYGSYTGTLVTIFHGMAKISAGDLQDSSTSLSATDTK